MEESNEVTISVKQNNNLAELNFELATLTQKIKSKIKGMQKKSTFSIFLFYVFIITSAVINASNTGINVKTNNDKDIILTLIKNNATVDVSKFDSNTNTFTYVLGVLGLITSTIIGMFNFQKMSLRKLKMKKELEKILIRIEQCKRDKRIDSKIKTIDKINNDLTELDYNIQKIEYGIESETNNE